MSANEVKRLEAQAVEDAKLIRDLRLEIRADNEADIKERAAFRSEIAKLEARLTASEARVKELGAEVAHISKHRDDVCRILTDERTAMRVSQAENVDLREKLATARAIVDDVHAHCPVQMGQPYALAYNDGWFDGTNRIKERLAALEPVAKEVSDG